MGPSDGVSDSGMVKGNDSGTVHNGFRGLASAEAGADDNWRLGTRERLRLDVEREGRPSRPRDAWRPLRSGARARALRISCGSGSSCAGSPALAGTSTLPTRPASAAMLPSRSYLL